MVREIRNTGMCKDKTRINLDANLIIDGGEEQRSLRWVGAWAEADFGILRAIHLTLSHVHHSCFYQPVPYKKSYKFFKIIQETIQETIQRSYLDN